MFPFLLALPPLDGNEPPALSEPFAPFHDPKHIEGLYFCAKALF